MRSMPTGRARRYVLDAGRAFERAPVEVTVAVVLAVAFSRAVELGDEAFRDWAETAIPGALIIAAAWTGTLLHGLGAITRVQRWIITMAGAALVALYAFLVLDLERLSEGWRAAVLLAAAVLWLVAVPALAGTAEGRTDRVRTVAGRLLLRTLGAVLYCGALFAGLALALAAVNTLFELNLHGEIYAHVWGWIFLVLGPWIVIGGLDEYTQPLEPRSEVAGVARRMLGFLVPPLVALYYAILYAYTIRIAVTGEVPKNLVSPLVLMAGALAVLAIFLFDPRREDAAGTRVLRLAPPLFVPLAALGAWTVLLRVGQYGWTEFRLLRLILLAALGILAIAGTVQLLRRQRFALHVIVLSLSALLLLAAAGPWSVMQVSRRSQQARLEQALTGASLDPAATRAPAGERPVPAALYDDITSTGRYLATHFGTGALPPLLAAHATDRGAVFDLAGRVGLRREPDGTERELYMAGSLGRGMVLRAGGLTVVRVETHLPDDPGTSGPGRPAQPAPSGAVHPAPPAATPAGTAADAAVARESAMATQDSTLLRIRFRSESFTADLEPLAALLVPEPGRPAPELPQDAAHLPVRDDTGRVRGSLLVLAIALRSEGGVLRVRSLDALLLLEEQR
jgi:hypothetical protein